MFGRFHILFLGIGHSSAVAYLLARTQTHQTLVSIGVVCFYKMYVVGGYYLCVGFLGERYYCFVHSQLIEVSLVAYIGASGFVELYFEVKVVAKYPLEPQECRLCTLYVVV